MEIVITIPITQEQFENIKENKHLDICGIELANAVINGVPLSEIKDRWKRGYERLYQEKMDELNTRKKELECELNMSIVQDHCRVLTDEITICCNDR